MQPEKPRLGGIAAIIVFIAVLLAFTIQSDLTTYIQTQLGFKQPYFLFYVAHSSFSFVFPLHLLYLVVTTPKSGREYLSDLSTVIHYQFSSNSQRLSPRSRTIVIFFMMFMGLTGPGLLWYISVSLTSISDVTALWNSNAFWAYVFTVKLYKLEWERRKLLAVIVACVGVLAIVYGGVAKSDEEGVEVESSSNRGHKSPFLGNLLALAASIWYGFFQVIYKKLVALPNDPEALHEDDATTQPPFSRLSVSSSNLMETSEEVEGELSTCSLPTIPFAFHPNFFISIVGVMTAVIMSFLFPILNYLDIEKFRLPPDLQTTLALACLATMGLVFNSGFMVLLGIWGPVITSVGGLLTIILVLFSDVIFVEGFGILSVWNSTGSIMIIGSFTILASEFKAS